MTAAVKVATAGVMDATMLLAQFERVADAPDAVGKLRRLVLDLAVRGKLVAQEAGDEPAALLLARITVELLGQATVGRVRAPRTTGAETIGPHQLPAAWVWSRLADVGRVSPRNEAYDSAQTSFVPMTLIAADFGIGNGHEVRRWGDIKKGYTHFAEGDVGLAKITPCFENGKSTVFRGLTGGLGSGTTELHVLRPILVVPEYVLIFLKSPQFIESGIPRMTGTAGQKRVPTDYFSNAPFPLPPLAEQHRIVSKVFELLTLCDQLEAARARRESVRDSLSAASLARLNARDAESFADDVGFALDALRTVTARPDQLGQFRLAILNIAVRGGLSGRGHPNPELKQLGDVARLQNGYAFKSEWFASSGVRLLRNANVSHGNIDWTDAVYVDDARAADYERFRLHAGDIVLSLDRPFITSGTKVAKVNAADLPALLLQRVGRFVVSEELRLDYLYLWICSPHFSSQIDPGRSNGVPHISSKQVEAANIFLPSLAEQARIVAKVSELMALCDRLETSLAHTAALRSRAFDALIRGALAPELVDETTA